MNTPKPVNKKVNSILIGFFLFFLVFLSARMASSVTFQSINLNGINILPGNFNIVPINFNITPLPVNTLPNSTVDAIAIRIVANPNQYSIDEWYSKQGFGGSPQKIKVDGYEAIRDNRTVYAAATNIKGACAYRSLGGIIALPPTFRTCSNDGDCLDASGYEKNCETVQGVCSASTSHVCSQNSDCPSGPCVFPKLYFNIYVITYNQGASTMTTDIFGKILSNWKFNNNINDIIGTCSLPVKNCLTTSDCPAEHNCDSQTLRCVSQRNCLIDTDCQGDALCNSPKASVLRDVKRLQSLNSINAAIAKYKDVHSKYPVLSSGTFLPQAVISTWPSWEDTFFSQLGMSTLQDPINKIGVCSVTPGATSTPAGFDAETCWNSTSKRYYDGSNSANLKLPAGSYVMAYTANSNGSVYDLCANMETAYTIMTQDSTPLNFSSLKCQTTATSGYTGAGNNPPNIVASNLTGIAGQEFVGYVKAEDPEGNPMTFSPGLTLSTPDYWTNAGWENPTDPTGQNAPILKPTTDPKQKKVWAQKAGVNGNYSFNVMVTDSNGASTSSILTIKINPSAPTITAPDVDYNLSVDPSNALNYNLYFTDPNFDYLELSFATSLAKASESWWKRLSYLFIHPALAATLIEAPIIVKPPIIAPPIIFPPIGCINPATIGGTPPAAGARWHINKDLIHCFNLNNGLKAKIYKEGEANYRLNIYGNLNLSSYSQDTNLTYKINVHNTANQNAEKSFAIRLKSNPPRLDFACNKKAALYQQYNCQVNNLNTTNGTVSYDFFNLPVGLTGDHNTGLITGLPSVIGEKTVRVRATNEYGATAEKEYTLTVESACGKTLVQYPGGPWDATGTIKNQGGYYKTVLVGDYCWLADNMNISSWSATATQQGTGFEFISRQPSLFIKILSQIFRANSASAQVGISLTTQQNTIGKCYNNNNAYCEAEGRLYRQSEAMAGSEMESARGICPPGWHVPSDEEYKKLALNLGMCSSGGITVPINQDQNSSRVDDNGLTPFLGVNTAQAQVLETFTCPNDNDVDVAGFVGTTQSNPGYKMMQNGDSGFEGLLAGNATMNNGTTTTVFANRSDRAFFWTSSLVSGGSTVWYRGLQKDEFRLERNAINPSSPSNKYYSLRCVQDRPCPAGCSGPCNTIGECCMATSWLPSITGKCGTIIQTSNCGTTRAATGTESCILPSVCGGTGTPNICGCTPNCAGKNCGSDGCGGSCGTCLGGQTCSNGLCSISVIGGGSLEINCIPNCAGKNCGSDGCTGSCGTCLSGQTCSSGVCTNSINIGGGSQSR